MQQRNPASPQVQNGVSHSFSAQLLGHAGEMLVTCCGPPCSWGAAEGMPLLVLVMWSGAPWTGCTCICGAHVGKGRTWQRWQRGPDGRNAIRCLGFREGRERQVRFIRRQSKPGRGRCLCNPAGGCGHLRAQRHNPVWRRCRMGLHWGGTTNGLGGFDLCLGSRCL